MMGNTVAAPDSKGELLDMLQRSMDDESLKARLKELAAAEEQHKARLKAAEEAEQAMLAERKKGEDLQAIVKSALLELDAKRTEIAERETAVSAREDAVAAREEKLAEDEAAHAERVTAHEAEHANKVKAAELAKRHADEAWSAADSARAEHEQAAAEIASKRNAMKAIWG